MAEQPAIPRAAMIHLLRALTMPACAMMRESWLERARACFWPFTPHGSIPDPQPLAD